VRVLDFGIAKQFNLPADSLTVTGTIVGTPLYISPEQATGKGVDHRTDIYALGCMAYELIVGRVPFDSDNVAELLSSHLVVPPPLPSSLWPEIRPELDQLLHSMIAKNPAERPTLAKIRDVIGALADEPVAPKHDVRPAIVSTVEPAPRHELQPAIGSPLVGPAPVEPARMLGSTVFAPRAIRSAVVIVALVAIAYIIVQLAL
jgi:serine/threonine protein kinase